MKEKKVIQMEEDLVHEGRDQVYLDIDRMINEGMSGGSVHSRMNSTNIEEARELVEEQPPYKLD